jgi:hypothetical protein
MTTTADRQGIHLKPAHIKALQDVDLVNFNQDGIANLVNHADPLRPYIQNILTFTIPIEVLPAYATTFGDLYQFSSTSTNSKPSTVFTCDNEASNLLKVAIPALLSLNTSVCCDDTAGTPEHQDFYEYAKNLELERLAREKILSNKNTQSGQEQTGPSSNNASSASSESSVLVPGSPSLSDKSKKKSKDGSKSSDSDSEDSSSSSSSSSSSDSNDEDQENEKTKDKTKKKTKAKQKQAASTPAAVGKKGTSAPDTAAKKTAASASQTIAVTSKRHRTDQDCVYDKMMADTGVLRTKMDLRGMSKQARFLNFKYNKETYPKVRIFVEELEGHASMPNKYIPISNRVKLNRTTDRVKEYFQTKEEEESMGARIGNGYLVGFRIWIFILDPAFTYGNRVHLAIQEQDRRKLMMNGSSRTYLRHPNPNYVKPLEDITSQSHYFTHIVLPYVTCGSSFRHANKDPVVRAVSRARQAHTSRGTRNHMIPNSVHNKSASSNDPEQQRIDDAVRDIYRRKNDRPFIHEEDRDCDYKVATALKQNVYSPSGVLREASPDDNQIHLLCGLTNSGFVTNMHNVCDTQTDPRNYYAIDDNQTQETARGNAKQTNTQNKAPPLTTASPVRQDDDDEMQVDTEDDGDPSRTVDFSKSINSMANSSASSSSASSTQKSHLDYELPNSQDTDDTNEDLPVDESESLSVAKRAKNVRFQTSDYYVLDNGMRIFGASNPDDHEAKMQERFELTERVTGTNARRFKGFPQPHLVTEYSNRYFGCNFVNALFPHIMRDVEDEPIRSYVNLISQQQSLKEAALKNRKLQQRQEQFKPLDPGTRKPSSDMDEIVAQTTNEQESTTHTSSETATDNETSDAGLNKDEQQLISSYKNPFVRFFLNYHEKNVRVKNTIRVNENELDQEASPKTSEELKNSVLRRVAQMTQLDLRHAPHEAIIFSGSHVHMLVQTYRDIEFNMNRSREIYLTEIARNQLTGSELEVFAQKNDLLMLRLKFCVESARIGCKYGKSDRAYRRAMRELRSRHCNDFVHILQYSSKLPASLKEALQWYINMAGKRRQFAKIPFSYKQFGIFGNYFQFVRGVLSDVMLGRNNTELFFSMYWVYMSSLCYTYYLRPNFIASGPATTSKSFNKDCVAQLSVPGTFKQTTHATEMHLLQSEDYYHLVHAYDEAPMDFCASSGSGKGQQRTAAAGGGSRVLKEIISSQKALMRTFYFDKTDPSGKPIRKVDEQLTALQITLICLCNLETLGPDSPLMQRFLFYVQPKKRDTNFKEADTDYNAATNSSKAVRSPTGGLRKQADNSNSVNTSEFPTTASNELPTKRVYGDEEFTGGPVRIRPTNLSRMCFENRDYQNPQDIELKETLQLLSFYVLLHEVMITACVVDDISQDLAERFLPEIFERYTKDIGAANISPRLMMQSALIARSMASTETMVTVLFTDKLHRDLINEKTVVVDESLGVSNLKPTERFERVTGLNISKLRRYCRLYSYIKSEHIATTATMMEHFVSNPYFHSVLQASLKVVGWSSAISFGNIRSITSRDESPYYSIIRRENMAARHTEEVYDARYVSISESTFEMCIDKIYGEMAEQISKNDVIRTLKAQKSIYIHAHGCMLMNSNWDIINKEYQARGNKAKGTDNSSAAAAPGKSTKKKRRDLAESEHREFLKGTKHLAVDKNKKEQSDEESSDDEDEEQEVPANNTDNRRTISSRLDNPQADWIKKCEESGRNVVMVKQDDGSLKPFYQPDNVPEMQSWLKLKYGSLDNMRRALDSAKERSQLGITAYAVFKNGNQVWMMFGDNIIPTDHIPVIRYENDKDSNKKRISVLLEYVTMGNRKSMKSAIQLTFASNSIPKEGVIYQSIKPYVGVNLQGQNEASSYLTDIIQISHREDRDVYCLNPVPSQGSGRKYLEFADIKLGGLNTEYSPDTRKNRALSRITSPFNYHNSQEDLENDDDNVIDSDSDNDDDDTFAELLPQERRPNPYVTDQKIRDAIRAADGLDFNGVPFDEFAQLRHWFRCGIDPTKQVTVDLGQSDPTADATKTHCPKYVFHSNELHTKMFRMMLIDNSKDPRLAPHICDAYTGLWSEELLANQCKERRVRQDCTTLKSIFGPVYNSSSISSGDKKKEHSHTTAMDSKYGKTHPIKDPKTGVVRNIRLVPMVSSGGSIAEDLISTLCASIPQKRQEEYRQTIITEQAAKQVAKLLRDVAKEDSRLGKDEKYAQIREAQKNAPADVLLSTPASFSPTSRSRPLEDIMGRHHAHGIGSEGVLSQIARNPYANTAHASAASSASSAAPVGTPARRPQLSYFTNLTKIVNPPKTKEPRLHSTTEAESNKRKRSMLDESPDPVETPLKVDVPAAKRRKLEFGKEASEKGEEDEENKEEEDEKDHTSSSQLNNNDDDMMDDIFPPVSLSSHQTLLASMSKKSPISLYGGSDDEREESDDTD